ncbi:MAG TPA: M67 family metallopeptidase [Acidobacteriota bacterium]|nr:M67 family metallopeptidase [Acidobacteriota bacterium]
MQLKVSRQLMASITERVQDAYPEEACGLLGGRREGETVQVAEAFPAPNSWPQDGEEGRGSRFTIAPGFHRRVHSALSKKGLHVVGVYHSHPDAPPQPSRFDLKMAWPELVYWIFSVRRGQARQSRAWRLRPSADQVEIICT